MELSTKGKEEKWDTVIKSPGQRLRRKGKVWLTRPKKNALKASQDLKKLLEVFEAGLFYPPKKFFI